MAARKTSKARRSTSNATPADGLKEVLALVPNAPAHRDSATATYNGLTIVRATMQRQFGIDPFRTKKPQHMEVALRLLTIVLEETRYARRITTRAEREATKAAQRTQHDQDRRAKLEALLQKHSGNVSEVAREMDKGRNQIVRWMDQYGLDRHAYRSA